MHPDLMRKLDHWIGVPACFILSLWLRLVRRRGDGDGNGPPRRILIICLAETGALVIANSAIQFAKRKFPHAEIFFLTFDTGREALALLGFDDDHSIILRRESPVRFAMDVAGALVRCNRLGIDATINLEVYARFSTLMAVLSGASRRAGFHRFQEEGHYLGRLITHPVIYSPHHHASTSYQILVQALSEAAEREPRAKVPVTDLPNERLRIHSRAAAKSSALARIDDALSQSSPAHGRFVILNANASDMVAVRRWPTQNYVRLARMLLEDETIVVVLTGTPSERPEVEKLKADIDRPRVANLAGRTSLEELIDLFNVCHLMITNDSGPAHFAATTQLPTIVLFGPETPRIFGPLGERQEAIYLALGCSPCVSVYNQKRSPCSDNQCMKRISVERVHERALVLLATEAAAPARARPVVA